MFVARDVVPTTPEPETILDAASRARQTFRFRTFSPEKGLKGATWLGGGGEAALFEYYVIIAKMARFPATVWALSPEHRISTKLTKNSSRVEKVAF